MKAYVYVSLKKSVLDPQGKTIQGALQERWDVRDWNRYARASISSSHSMAA
jgi:phosphoribosylformylglycinamidine (FGAM) synthase PurS component